MPADPNTAAPSTTSSRRSLLKAGTIGLGTAFLAACSKKFDKPGISGTPVTTTLVPPTAPPPKITKADKTNDNVMLKTNSSLELLVAKAYADNASRVTSPEWSSQMARFQADHEATATVFSDAATGDDPRTTKPNAYLEANLVKPGQKALTDEASTLDFLASLESMLVATYITGAGSFTTADWRQKVMTAGAASARRAALLGNGGTGKAPTQPLYPLLDLIPSKAMLTDESATTGS